MIEISVIIGTRNQRHILETTLDSFARQTLAYSAFEVIVVDSESTDGTAELCRGGHWPFALYFDVRSNAGKCAARNDAIRRASGRLVFLTDADVVADPGMLAAHVASHAIHPGAIVVGRQWLVDRADEIGVRRREALQPAPAAGARLTWRQFVTGNASLERETLIAVGAFDEAFSGYGYEDYELGYRLAQGGARFVFAPEAVNWHCHRVAFDDDLRRKHEAGEAAVLFARKHASLSLRVELGLHPINRWLWRIVSRDGVLVRAARRHRHDGGRRGQVARWFLIEQAFQAGVRKALSS